MENNEAYYTRTIYVALRLGFIALLLVWSYLIVRPFILLTIWGIILAVALYPLFKWLTARLGGRKKLSATLITVVGMAVLIIPSVMLIDSAISGISGFAEKMEAGAIQIAPPNEKVAHWPVIGKATYEAWDLASRNFDEAVTRFEPQIKKMAPKVFAAASDLVKTLGLFILSLLVMGIMFVFAKPAKHAAQSIFDTLVGPHGKNFVPLSVSIIKSVVIGILGIASIQALLGGLGMWVAGIPAAGLWALLILMVAIVQLPPILVLGPIAIYSFSILDTTPAIIFTVWSLVVSTSDTFLKPLFLGRGVAVPMPAVLLGAIGGVILYGLIGLFVGAVVLSITYEIFEALLVEDVLDTPHPVKESGKTEGTEGT